MPGCTNCSQCVVCGNDNDRNIRELQEALLKVLTEYSLAADDAGPVRPFDAEVPELVRLAGGTPTADQIQAAERARKRGR